MSGRSEMPFGIHEEIHNRIQLAVEKLDTVLATPVQIPPYGDTPGSTLPFDYQEATSLVREIASLVTELDLKHQGLQRGHGVSVRPGVTSSFNVYDARTVAAARELCDKSRGQLVEDAYFDYGQDPSGGPARRWISQKAYTLINGVKTDLRNNSKMQELLQKEAASRAAFDEGLKRFSLDTPPPPGWASPAAPEKPGKVSVVQRVRDALRPPARAGRDVGDL